MRLLLLIVLVAAAGCGKKKAPVATAEEIETVEPGFVEIDFGAEDDAMEEMFGSELMSKFAECGDLIKLEPAAMMGKLSDAEIRCLDRNLHEADRQTVKDKVSRVLMNDAWAKQDMHRWETVVRRHLEEIDRSDPDLCYKFSAQLATKDASYADETMRWSDVALENRSFWQGDLHVKRVYALMKIKAMASQKKWQSLEQAYIDDPREEVGSQRDEARNKAKTVAREWLEYARQAGKDPTMAMQFCVSAAGTSDFCQDG